MECLHRLSINWAFLRPAEQRDEPVNLELCKEYNLGIRFPKSLQMDRDISSHNTE